MTQPAYLTRTVIHDGRIIAGLNTVRADRRGYVTVEPFDCETPATIYHDGPVAVVSAEALTDTLIDDLEMLGRDPARIAAYLAAAGLYAGDGAGVLLAL